MVLQEALLTSASSRRAKVPQAKDAAVVSTDAILLSKDATRRLLAAALVHGTDEEAVPLLVQAALADAPDGPKASPEHVKHALRILRRLLSGSADTSRLSNGVHVNVGQLRERARYILAARSLIASHTDRLPPTVRGVATTGVHRWQVPWTSPADDFALVQGVLRHGWGEWAAIAADPDLGLARLADTIGREGAIPRDIHLGRRVENVLMHVMRSSDLDVDAKPDHKPKTEKASQPKSEKMSQSKSEKVSRPKSEKQTKSERTTQSKRNQAKADTPTTPQNVVITKGTLPKTARQTTLSFAKREATVDERLRALLRPVRQDVVLLAGLSADDVGSRSEEVLGALRRVGFQISTAGDDAELRGLAWSRLADSWPLEITPVELEAFCARI